MANIIFNVNNFICEEPVIGNTYRLITGNSSYVFNWSTEGSLYESRGLNAQVRLFYLLEGELPEYEYTASPLPFVANDLNLGQFNADITDFRFEFSVNNDDNCYYSINIPYSQIILV